MNRRRLFSTVATSVMLIVPFSVPAAAGAQTTDTACGNAPAGYNVIETDARFITGTPERDFICAGDSNNIIRAKGKNDIIYAGGGNDVIWGGYGNDTIWAGSGNDLIRAGSGKDAVSAGAGNDKVLGGAGADTIRGDAGDDDITGGEGHDMIDGGDGADKLVGNRGIDQLVGGLGNDVGQGGVGTDTLLGGAGDDILNGGDSNDIIGGGNGNDRLLGGNGNDSMTGGNGNDALIGGGNPDVLRGSAGDDILDGGNGLNVALGGPGQDQCKNADSPRTACEVVDGIDSTDPPARIWLLVPSAESPGSMVAGTNWTPNVEIDVTIIDVAGAAATPTETLMSDEFGDWELLIATQDLVGRKIRVADSDAGRIKTLDPALDSFEWNADTDDLDIVGEPGATMEAQIFYPSTENLVFVEQMTMDAAGRAAANFSEVDEIGVFELRRSDDDGDVEIHSNVTLEIVEVVPVVNAPKVQAAVLVIQPDVDELPIATNDEVLEVLEAN